MTLVCENRSTETDRNVMRFTYSPLCRAMVISQICAGKSVARIVASELGLIQATI